MSEARKMLTARLDKTLSRESLAIVGTLLSLAESHADPSVVALFGGVAMMALSGEKAARHVAELYVQARTLKTDAMAVIDTQSKATSGPGFAVKAGSMLLALGAGLGIGTATPLQGCAEPVPKVASADGVGAVELPEAVTMAADATVTD